MLFRDHSDLLEEFKHFLPDTSTAPQVLKGAASIKQDDDKTQVMPPDRKVQSIKVTCTTLGY
jgi:paired amphipathic helix protein Sin3a